VTVAESSSLPAAEAPARPARRPRRRLRFLLVVLALAFGLPVPLLWTLGRLTGHPGAAVGVAALLTAGFLAGLFDRASFGAPGRARLYLLLWPFFVYWTAAMFFALLVPLALGLGAVVHAATSTTLSAALAVTALVTAASFIHRTRIARHDVAIPSLPPDFDGYRVVQLTDLHCGPFASERRIERWVAAANRLDADLVAVTGDLIASGPTFVPVVARALGALRGRDGVFACMGNHDYFTEGASIAAALAEHGLRVLRNEGVVLERAGGRLYLAGVDDTWTGRDDLDATLAARPAGTTALLLAHDPALFPGAAARGVELTLSGHTHGGQLGVPFSARRFNLARVITRFTSGFYREGASTLFVSHGLGTTGVPIRWLVAPEIAVLTLRRASSAPTG
jgi:predicted MPP superfamily phosphohydrolase